VAGKLRVVRTVGFGGMGVVYEVEHELTKHRRALKVLHARAAQQPGVLERFFREASAAGRIGNAHVAEAFDAGRLESGEPYLLMELVEGETLDQRLRRQGVLGPGELAEIVCQACEGVQAAHEAGIVHRDLKPENLIVAARDGAPFVKILDFGISKFDAERTGSMGITTEGLVMGTPYYMSPEQVRGASLIDVRTDVYALGVILYECSSGVRPYDARSIEALAVFIHEGNAVPLAERQPTLPPDFCAVVHRAMAKDRDQRYPSARALGEALLPFRARGARGSFTAPGPRVVVRPSARPSPTATDAQGRLSSVVPSTDAALASTMGGETERRARRVRAAWFIAGVSVLVGAVGALVVARLPAPSRSVSPTAGANPGSASHPSVVELTPLPVAPPGESATAGTDRGAPTPVDARGHIAGPQAALANTSPELVRAITATTANAPLARVDAAAPAPASTGTGKSRVDQTGLAGENPFR
jgi:serine/threonine-protein kinase